jgi:hypothetical protein
MNTPAAFIRRGLNPLNRIDVTQCQNATARLRTCMSRLPGTSKVQAGNRAR